MDAPPARWHALCLSLLAFSSLFFAEFSMRSLSVMISINKDGSAHVEEHLAISISGKISKELYESTRVSYSDLATWKERTQLSEMRHHVTRANTEIVNLRVLPQPIERCNSLLDICYATVIIDYNIPLGKNGTGLVRVENYKPRTSRYSLAPEALSFEQTRTGDLILPQGTKISISIPQNAEKIFISNPPQELLESPENFRYDEQENLRFYVGEKRTFEWQGDTLSKFQFSYEIEAPLESEVIEFFSSWQRRVASFMFSPQGPAAAIIFLAAAASIFYINRFGSK
ncbi:MAG: hypothetical protein N3F07_01100 [Candidatus Micrarchaeota archaeon]|nr:hypothetical protein [Candidatus Micrarchaeota archaeon]